MSLLCIYTYLDVSHVRKYIRGFTAALMGWQEHRQRTQDREAYPEHVPAFIEIYEFGDQFFRQSQFIEKSTPREIEYQRPRSQQYCYRKEIPLRNPIFSSVTERIVKIGVHAAVDA